MAEALIDIDRDYYEELGKSNDRFAPYVKHLINRYYDDEFEDWESCKTVIDIVRSENISSGDRWAIMKSHDYKEKGL